MAIIRPSNSEEPSGRYPTSVRSPWNRLTTSGSLMNSEELNIELPSHFRAPKDSSASLLELASTLPWSCLTIPDSLPSSEELNTELPSRLEAPRSSSASLHGLASTPPWRHLMTSHPRPNS